MSNPDASSERERGDPGGKEWDEFGVSTLTVAPHAEDREKTVEGTRVFPPPPPASLRSDRCFSRARSLPKFHCGSIFPVTFLVSFPSSLFKKLKAE